MDFELTPPTPYDLGLPHKQWWRGQREGVEQILSLWRDGINVVMVSGPTGSGKSGVGLASAAAWSALKERPLNVTVLTQTKDLQEQYANAFDCETATGRGNWQCFEAPRKRGNQCPLIGTERGCPPLCDYRRQRERALQSPIRIVNYALYGATRGLFHAPVMVADEADYLGDLLTDAHSVDLSLLVDEYQLQVPQGLIDQEELIQLLEDIQEESAVPEERQACKHGIELCETKRYAIKGVGNLLIPFPPSKVVQDFTRQPTLIMSATVMAPQYWSQEWNVPIGWVELPCPTPPTARPIKLLNIKKLNNRTTEAEWMVIIEAIDRLIAERVELKGVIHSVSNWLTDLILKHSKYKYLMFKAAGPTRLSGINAFIQAERGVLIGPNLTRGLDLADDLCRYIIWPKLPYPSLVDPRVQEMMKGGEDRYTVETLSTLVQGCGRGVRNKDDSCESFILDSGAGWLFKKSATFLPQWFREAIIWKTE